MLASGAEVNAQDANCVSTLAAGGSHRRAATLPLDHRANPQLADYLPIFAVKGGDVEAADLLVEPGTEISRALRKSLTSPLCWLRSVSTSRWRNC